MRLKDMFSELAIIVDNGKPKIYGKNLRSGSFIKKTLNAPYGDLKKIEDGLNDIIKKGFNRSDIERMHKYVTSGLFCFYTPETLITALELINSYGEKEKSTKSFKDEIDIINIINAGKSGSGKSTLIKQLINKRTRDIFSSIVGIRETTTFQTLYYLLSPDDRLVKHGLRISENNLYILARFKDKEEIIDSIRQGILRFIERHNEVLFSNADINNVWDYSIDTAISEFLCDEDKVFNIEVLFGKYDESIPFYKRIKTSLVDILIECERKKLEVVEKLINDSNELINSKLSYFNNKKNQSFEENEKIIQELNVEYANIFDINCKGMERVIVDLIFSELIASVKEQFQGIVDEEDMYSLKSYDDIRKALENYLLFEMPSDYKKREENVKLKNMVSGFLRKLYASNRNIDFEKSHLSPIVKSVDIILPINPEVNLQGKSYSILDTIGLDHGNKVDKERVAKRLMTSINQNEPDIVLLNLNFSEKIDLLEDSIGYLEQTGYLDRTIFLASHLDIIFEKNAEDNYTQQLIDDENFIDIVQTFSEITQDAFNEKFDLGMFTKEDIDKNDKPKFIDKTIERHFKEILISVKNVVENEIKTSLKVDYKKIEENFIFIDKLSKLSKTIEENELKFENAIKKIFNSVNRITEFYRQVNNTEAIRKINVTINQDNFVKALNSMIDKYRIEQDILYSKSNSDLRWNTVDKGLLSLKYNGIGQIYGSSYDITPGVDFLNRFYFEMNTSNQDGRLFDLVFKVEVEPAVDEVNYRRLVDSFNKNFNKRLSEVFHYFFVTNYIGVFDSLYNLRYHLGLRNYPFLPMTSERKIRLRELLMNLASNVQQLDTAVRIAVQDAIVDIMDNL